MGRKKTQAVKQQDLLKGQCLDSVCSSFLLLVSLPVDILEVAIADHGDIGCHKIATQIKIWNLKNICYT